jgi:hypothetical protein
MCVLKIGCSLFHAIESVGNMHTSVTEQTPFARNRIRRHMCTLILGCAPLRIMEVAEIVRARHRSVIFRHI